MNQITVNQTLSFWIYIWLLHDFDFYFWNDKIQNQELDKKRNFNSLIRKKTLYKQAYEIEVLSSHLVESINNKSVYNSLNKGSLLIKL